MGTPIEVTDIIGEKFGLLTVRTFLEKKEGSSQNRYYYNCECDCGEWKRVERSNLITEHTNSCGCLKKKKGDKNKCWKGHGEISGRMWSAIKSKAQERSLSFEITIEDAWKQFEEQAGKCALTGLPISLLSPKDSYSDKTASLDRIDNTKGYEKGNIQWLHKDVNWMKGCFALERFIEICNLVSKHQEIRKAVCL